MNFPTGFIWAFYLVIMEVQLIVWLSWKVLTMVKTSISENYFNILNYNHFLKLDSKVMLNMLISPFLGGPISFDWCKNTLINVWH